jgi:hypothetical protein
MRRSLLAASALLLLVLLTTLWQESRQSRPVALTPVLTGQVEYCLTCHADLPEISRSHPVKTFGCVLCHGGERLALDADLAHSTMRGGKNPSDFSVVEASCGGDNCHSGAAADYRDHIQRATTSIQATYAGAIASIRYTFGAQPDPNARMGIYAIQAPHSASGITGLAAFNPAEETNPAIKAFAQDCLNCHLSAPPLAGDEYSRFSGCAACHTPLSDSPPIFSENGGSRRGVHILTTAIPYTQCNRCHNRGNYDLRTMTFQPHADQPTDSPSISLGQRLHDYYQPIAQFTRCEWTLDCVDCHTRAEVMGDGSLYSSKKEIQYIQCRTCHGTLTELPNTKKLTDPNDLAFRLAFLNESARHFQSAWHLEVGDTILVTEKGEPLWNIRPLPDGTYELFEKATGQRFTFRPVMASGCQQKPDEQASQDCHKCHAVER